MISVNSLRAYASIVFVLILGMSVGLLAPDLIRQSFAAACGDGNLDGGEQCDDLNVNNNDGCTSTCQFEAAVCGNGRIDRGEYCDDGNTNDGDGCLGNCGGVECTVDADCTYTDVCFLDWVTGGAPFNPSYQDWGNGTTCFGGSCILHMGIGGSCSLENGPAVCGDGLDNDGDINIDCVDSDCDGLTCGASQTCQAGVCTGGSNCPNGACTGGETCANCPADCGSCPSSVCDNDGSVDAGETCSNCPYDVRCTAAQKCIAGACSSASWSCKREDVCGDGWVSDFEECDDGGICTGSTNASLNGILCMDLDPAGDKFAGVARCRATGGICVAQDNDGCTSDCQTECKEDGAPCLLASDCCGNSCADGVCGAEEVSEDSCFTGVNTQTLTLLDGGSGNCPGLDTQTIALTYNGSQWVGSRTLCGETWSVTYYNNDPGVSCGDYRLTIDNTSVCIAGMFGGSDLVSDDPHVIYQYQPFPISDGASCTCCNADEYDYIIDIRP